MTRTVAGGSREAVEQCLDRIAARDDEVHAWAHLDPVQARRAADLVDRVESDGRLLHGVPVGLKDIIDTADQPTAYGSNAWAGHVPAADAAVVQRLRRAGAVILGKTATTEFATYRPSAARNPHRLDHTPGGSSSGSAAAVADGQVPVAVGTQTAGSVLRPGAFCGVFTLKPTYGRWTFDGTLPVALTFDTLGAFARHPAWLGAIDTAVAEPAGVATLPPTAGLRIGVLRPPWADRATPAAAAALEGAADTLRGVAADVVDVPVDADYLALDEAHTLLMAAEAAAALAPMVTGRESDVDQQTLAFLATGRAAQPSQVQKARAVMRSVRALAARLLTDVDVLLTLAAPGEAPHGLDSTGDPVFNKLASIAGLPAVGLPVGRGDGGLPLGIQLIGPEHSDQSLVRIASCLTDRHEVSRFLPSDEESS
ncbi:amidase [Gordonia aichiensis]|uniref:amidase n=2 Tax=Gordonia TaxID=2053 RepID=UPI0032650C0D